MRITLSIFLLVVSLTSLAQNKFTLNGYVKDGSSGETLIGATVFISQLSTGVVTNEYGFYSITLAEGSYEVSVSYVGFEGKKETIDLKQNLRKDFELASDAEQLEEVVVTGELEQANAQNIEMSTNKLEITTVTKLPAFLGEADILKSLLLLPGVSTVGEGASGFNVRGGSVGQNLVLLDEAPVYNTSHLFGFFSVFNPDAVKDTKLYKGAVPSRYGGRLASILDVRMKEGNSKKFEATGGIGTVFSRLAIESPIIKDKSSFIVAARRSYLDVLAKPFTDIFDDGAALNFYDLTAKANYNIDARNRIFVSGYFGRDRFLFDKDQGFSWGNSTSSLRWNHLFSDKLFANFTGIFSRYDYKLQFGNDNLNLFKWNSNITNLIFKPEFTWFINQSNEIHFGGEFINYSFEPANAVGITNGAAVDISIPRKYNQEGSIFAGNTQKVSEQLTLDYGLRLSRFRYYGPGESFVFRDTIPGVRKPVASITQYEDGETIQTYTNLQPRAAIKWQLSPTNSLKASYNRMVQYLHLISNTTASNPLDVWTPSTNNIKPELADQYTVGWFADLNASRSWEISVETYYRRTSNQVDYIDGADLLINQFLEGDLLSGRGRAYGMEFYLQKKTGKFNGWASYTLGKTELQTEGINQGEWYPTRFDQRHNFKVSGFYDLPRRWSVSANFIYSSGTPVTFPTSRFVMQNILIPYSYNDARNNVRLPAYHRLDLSFRLDGKKLRRGKERRNTDYWVFGVYNLYGRKNPFSIYFSQKDERTPFGLVPDAQATQLAIVGTVIPSISYNFKF